MHIQAGHATSLIVHSVPDGVDLLRAVRQEGAGNTTCTYPDSESNIGGSGTLCRNGSGIFSTGLMSAPRIRSDLRRQLTCPHLQNLPCLSPPASLSRQEAWRKSQDSGIASDRPLRMMTLDGAPMQNNHKMKTKTSLLCGLAFAMFSVAIGADTGPQKPTSEPKGQSITLADSHEGRLRALVSERLKLKASKSALLMVLSAAKELRDVELQMSNTPTQRVAAFARYSVLITEFEGEAVTALDHRMIRKHREDAEADLLRARRDLK